MQAANLRYVYQISMVAALGGLLFGYDTAVISGAAARGVAVRRMVDGRAVTTGPGVPPSGWLYGEPCLDTIADEVFSISGLKRRAGRSVDPAELLDPALWEAFGRDLGRFLAPYVEAFGAEVVLVLGGLAGAFPLFGEALNGPLAGRARPGRLGWV